MLTFSSLIMVLILFFSKKFNKKYYYMSFPMFLYILFTVLIDLNFFEVAENVKEKLLYVNIVVAIAVLITNKIIINKKNSNL